MDEYEKIRQRKREEYRKRHRAQVRRKQLIGNGIVIGVIILIIATIIIVVALRGKKAKQEEVKAEVTPIPVPEGNNVLSVIAIDQNTGKCSDIYRSRFEFYMN